MEKLLAFMVEASILQSPAVLLATGLVAYIVGPNLKKRGTNRFVRATIYGVGGVIGGLVSYSSLHIPSRQMELMEGLFLSIGLFAWSTIVAGTVLLIKKSLAEKQQPTVHNSASIDHSAPSRIGWWRSRKEFRLWIFGTAVWAIAVLLFVVAFEHYGSRIDDDEYLNMIFLMLAPPVFVGVSRYVYKTWIK